MKASHLNFDRNTGFLLKGPPGFGKTIAACSAAIWGPVFLAYIDKKVPVELLAFYRKHRPELLDNIEYESYGSTDIFKYLNKIQTFRDNCPYVAVITDGVTSLTSAAVNWSMGFRDVKGGAKTDKLNKEAPQMIPDWDDYKVETSLVSQALDITKSLNVMNIWTAHPLTTTRIEGSGASVDRVTKGSSLVSYGSKVGSLIPGSFQEIYHFGSQGGKRAVFTSMAGEDYAKTVFDIPSIISIEGKLFFEVWRDAVNASFKEEPKDDSVNPFAPKVASASKWKV